jgi:hypothetical protein
MPSLLSSIEFISMVLVFWGVYLITRPDRKGMYVMVAAQLGWGIYALMVGAPWLLIQNIVLLGLNVVGVRRWKKQGIG